MHFERRVSRNSNVSLIGVFVAPVVRSKLVLVCKPRTKGSTL